MNRAPVAASRQRAARVTCRPGCRSDDARREERGACEAFRQDHPFEREFKGIQQFEPVSRTHEGLMDILHLGRRDEAGYFYYVMELADDANAERGGRNAEVPGSGPAAVSRSAFRAPSSYVPHTLRQELRTHGPLPIDRLLELGLQLSAALEHLHRHGLVHRDVKPSNVIFVNGEAKLADAGLVARMDDAQSLVGTAGYIAPEGPGTPQADIYGLGKLLYEAAFGKDRQEFPQLPSDLGSHPDHQRLLELNEIIARACAHDAELRYRTALELQQDLERLRQGESVRRHHLRQTVRRQLRRSAPVGALLLLGVGIMAFWWRQQQPGSLAAAPEPTIFVLPFRHSAPGPTRAESWELPTDVCFCGRLTDAFIDGLTLIPGIRTGPRKSGWIRHDEDEIRRELARTNDTRYVLTGRVDHTNDVLRLVLRLYERQRESPVWSATFAGTTNEVVTLEKQAIAAIARGLDLPVAAEVQDRIEWTLTNNLAAYTWFHRARSRYFLSSSADFYQSFADYTAALDTDPRYTAAMVGVMWLRGEIGFEQPPRTVQPEIYNRARQLLALDDTVFLAHSRIVYRLLHFDYDWEGALKYIDWMRAVWPEAHLEQAIWMRTLGRTNESRVHHERLMQQPDPGYMELTFIAFGESVWRRSDLAIAAAERFSARYPESVQSPFLLGWVYLRAGDYPAAIAHLKQAAGPGPGPLLLGLLGRAHALAGDRATALDFLRQLEPRVVAGEADPYFLAWIQMGLGQAEDALRNLDRAVDFKSLYITHSDFGGLRTDPAWDALQGDPRFEKLCESVGMGKGQWPK